ncbi:hypothetical protein H8B09_19435 [Paenibacillus sp. PR3]|uniref:Uncharacterized protein n=1 Tax=Paenibacillus terricola TaxID=2763503 RepID=A0ABR8MYC7_9BACL|nr:hypothetical protein [Paenibacillus terricola]MBD3920948.1 hypothetical protein [Paenibacillus terricola]
MGYSSLDSAQIPPEGDVHYLLIGEGTILMLVMRSGNYEDERQITLEDHEEEYYYILETYKLINK